MESVSKQEYMRVLSELDMLTNKFVALEQENQKLLVDLQHVSTEKPQVELKDSTLITTLPLITYLSTYYMCSHCHARTLMFDLVIEL